LQAEIKLKGDKVTIKRAGIVAGLSIASLAGGIFGSDYLVKKYAEKNAIELRSEEYQDEGRVSKFAVSRIKDKSNISFDISAVQELLGPNEHAVGYYINEMERYPKSSLEDLSRVTFGPGVDSLQRAILAKRLMKESTTTIYKSMFPGMELGMNRKRNEKGEIVDWNTFYGDWYDRSEMGKIELLLRLTRQNPEAVRQGKPLDWKGEVK